jgi:hypothetical protein
MTYATIRPSTFEEAEFSTLPVCWDIRTTWSIFHDEVVDEEKAAEERLSTQPRKNPFEKAVLLSMHPFQVEHLLELSAYVQAGQWDKFVTFIKRKSVTNL